MANWRENLLDEVRSISERQKITNSRAFIFWYIKASENLSDQEIMDTITDKSKDGGSDAVIINHNTRVVKILQSKFTGDIGETCFDKDELLKVTRVGDYIRGQADYDQLKEYIHPKLREKLDTAVRLIKDDAYNARILFITTHKANPNGSLYKDSIEILSSSDIERKFEEWRHGQTPELGEIKLDYISLMEGPERPRAFLANLGSAALRREYLRFKEKLFSRNVRIFYSDKKKPNKEMKGTLTAKPEYFWYFNNGITILSEKVTVNRELKQIVLMNPQIINGCQTVSTIGESKQSAALLFAKIIEIADSVSQQGFIDGIIQANNRQTPVDERMLRSNHPLQVIGLPLFRTAF